MDIDSEKLGESEFWKKKLDRAVRVRDVNKSGYISRADFMQMVERYKQLDTATPEHVEKLTKKTLRTCDGVGLTDDSVRLSYAQFKERFWATTKGVGGERPSLRVLRIHVQ